jgi:hypothetical protein
VYEDRVFFVKIALRGGVYVADHCWVKYRQHEGSSCAAIDQTNRRAGARQAYMTWLEAYLSEQGYRGTRLWRLARKWSLRRGDELGPTADSQSQGENQLLRLRLTKDVRGLVQTLGLATRRLARRVLPARPRRRLGALLRRQKFLPPPSHVRFGDLRRLTPISKRFGKDRGGAPIDRLYIEQFLARHASDIQGRVLEVQDANYTRRFGGDRVARSDVLHVVPGNPQATIVADLASAPGIPCDQFDCLILTQVLLCVEDLGGALRTIHRILRPGGVVLATVPGISQVVRHDMERWGDYWRFTTLSARRLFESVFPSESVLVESHGNVLAAVAFLHGLTSRELQPAELDHNDPDYQLLITIRAVKPRAEVCASEGLEA